MKELATNIWEMPASELLSYIAAYYGFAILLFIVFAAYIRHRFNKRRKQFNSRW